MNSAPDLTIGQTNEHIVTHIECIKSGSETYFFFEQMKGIG